MNEWSPLRKNEPHLRLTQLVLVLAVIVVLVLYAVSLLQCRQKNGVSVLGGYGWPICLRDTRVR